MPRGVMAPGLFHAPVLRTRGRGIYRCTLTLNPTGRPWHWPETRQGGTGRPGSGDPCTATTPAAAGHPEDAEAQHDDGRRLRDRTITREVIDIVKGAAR